MEKVIHLILLPDHVMISHDVEAPFPSVPIKDALDIIHFVLVKLKNDPSLSEGTPLRKGIKTGGKFSIFTM